jgi:periplasmic protein TonB
MVFGLFSGDDRVLGAALGISIALHATALAVHFKSPDPSRLKAHSQQLDVVLVNARTRERPARAEVLAQVNLDRGGNVDENRRAATPLPAAQRRKPGRDLKEAQRRMQQLEAQQRELLAQARKDAARPLEPPRPAPTEQATTEAAGSDPTDLALAAMRLQAEIERRIEEYQKRPRKQFIGANAREYRFAQYEEDWRLKIERIGTQNYPADARGRYYGNLRLTVTIRADGSVDSIELDRSSGQKVLDAAAFKIVQLASPFAAFPPDIRRDTDLLVITRTWFFGKGDKMWTEARP